MHFTPPPDVADAVETVEKVVGEDVTVATELVGADEIDVLDSVPGTHW